MTQDRDELMGRVRDEVMLRAARWGMEAKGLNNKEDAVWLALYEVGNAINAAMRDRKEGQTNTTAKGE